MRTASVYIEIYKILPCKTDVKFLDNYAWNTDAHTFRAFYEAKARFNVSSDNADYIVDLFTDSDELFDHFRLDHHGYRSLTATK